MTVTEETWERGDRGWTGAAVDVDGDVWGQRSSGHWICLTDDSGTPLTTEGLANRYGPLTVTPDAPKAIAEEATTSLITEAANVRLHGDDMLAGRLEAIARKLNGGGA